jgi:hypothetical protein
MVTLDGLRWIEPRVAETQRVRSERVAVPEHGAGSKRGSLRHSEGRSGLLGLACRTSAMESNGVEWLRGSAGGSKLRRVAGAWARGREL